MDKEVWRRMCKPTNGLRDGDKYREASDSKNHKRISSSCQDLVSNFQVLSA